MIKTWRPPLKFESVTSTLNTKKLANCDVLASKEGHRKHMIVMNHLVVSILSRTSTSFIRRNFATSSQLLKKLGNDELKASDRKVSGRYTTQEIHRVDNPLFPDVDIPKRDDLNDTEDSKLIIDSSEAQNDVDYRNLSHVNDSGHASMVNVSTKDVTRRIAVARGKINLGPTAFRLVKENRSRKGDVLTVSQIAGIIAAKRCDELIPLCHSIPLDNVEVNLVPNDSDESIDIEAKVECRGRTGVEMEALMAVSVSALTVYDMVKAVEKSLRIGDIRLVRKSGGRSGNYEAD